MHPDYHLGSDPITEFEQFPFGSLPVLEYNGLVLAQSITIGRFLANKYGLAGESEQDKAKADMVVDLVLDYYDSKSWT